MDNEIKKGSSAGLPVGWSPCLTESECCFCIQHFDQIGSVEHPSKPNFCPTVSTLVVSVLSSFFFFHSKSEKSECFCWVLYVLSNPLFTPFTMNITATQFEQQPGIVS